jgi:gamma-glutamyl hercynylcysteine S-oxide hydrolase
MCRHIAYLVPPVSLRSVLIDPPFGLYRQAWAPRRQRHGTVNADGFGIGWYADGDPVPARYRRAIPMWGDGSLPDLARVVRSAAVLAAVRSATAGMALGEAAVAPFASGRWLFSHNGVLDGWPASAEALAVPAWAERASVPASAEQPFVPASAERFSVPSGVERRSVPNNAFSPFSLEAMVDSAFLWALVLGRLEAGDPPEAALAETIVAIEAAGGTGRFNFLMTDGRSVVATAAGDTLWYRRADDAVIVASEPGDDGPGWIEVPDRQVLTAAPDRVTVRPLTTHTERIAVR